MKTYYKYKGRVWEMFGGQGFIGSDGKEYMTDLYLKHPITGQFIELSGEQLKEAAKIDKFRIEGTILYENPFASGQKRKIKIYFQEADGYELYFIEKYFVLTVGEFDASGTEDISIVIRRGSKYVFAKQVLYIPKFVFYQVKEGFLEIKKKAKEL